MEGAPHMRLHRNQGLQRFAAVPLYFPLLAAGLHSPAVISFSGSPALTAKPCQAP